VEDLTDPYGLAVALRHDFGYDVRRLYTVYAHLESTLVWPGQRVEAGEQIGSVGDTGRATAPHLHFEVRLGENRYFDTRNPELWMVPAEGWGAGRQGGEHLRHLDAGIPVQIRSLDGQIRRSGLTLRNGGAGRYYQENRDERSAPETMVRSFLQAGLTYATRSANLDGALRRPSGIPRCAHGSHPGSAAPSIPLAAAGANGPLCKAKLT
jgi:murein DD-endopeptidase MepM/ murein hydrolase activator NlpD